MPSEPSQPQEFKRKVGRPLGCKDSKPRKFGSGAWQQKKSRSTNTKPEGCFRSYRPHPSKPYYTSKPTVQEQPDTWFLKPHQVKKFDEICPLGIYKDDRQDPFKVSFK